MDCSRNPPECLDQILSIISANPKVVHNVKRHKTALKLPENGKFNDNALPSPKEAFLLLKKFTSNENLYGPFGKGVNWVTFLEVVADTDYLWSKKADMTRHLKIQMKLELEQTDDRWHAMGRVFKSLKSILQKAEYFGKDAEKSAFILQMGNIAFWDDKSITNDAKFELVPVILFLIENSVSIFE